VEREEIANEVATHGLECITQVYNWAKSESVHGFKPPTIMNPNATTSGKVREKHRLEYDKNKVALQAMLSVPVLARVKYSEEDGKEQEVYILRGPNPTEIPFRTASNNSPLAGLASLKPGDGELVVIKMKERDLLVSEVVTFRPIREEVSRKWDSIDTRIETEKSGTFSIPSLLNYNFAKSKNTEDPWLDENDSFDIIDGFRKELRTGFGLRDQPIPDKVQRDISRLPLNITCFVSGPAGTGKTTTLIRRLGQTTDLKHRGDEAELRLIQKVEQNTGRPHDTNWIMFSPTDLLKEYVKEAFARENQTAPSERLRTWDSFRRELARDILKLIRSANRRSGFILIDDSSYLNIRPQEISVWFDDFDEFRRSRDKIDLLL